MWECVHLLCLFYPSQSCAALGDNRCLLVLFFPMCATHLCLTVGLLSASLSLIVMSSSGSYNVFLFLCFYSPHSLLPLPIPYQVCVSLGHYFSQNRSVSEISLSIFAVSFRSFTSITSQKWYTEVRPEG